MYKIKNLIKISSLLIVCLLLVTLVGCKGKKAVEKTFPEIVSELNSYILDANLETKFPNGSKKCTVKVFFKKPNYYRVELINSDTNEKQIMIRNDKGVFVILPSINKTFKINSEWPTTSNQPFLLQSLSNDIVSNTDIIKTDNGGSTTLELKTKLFNNVEPTKEQIVFNNKTKLPTDIYVYRTNGELFNHVKINNIETNKNIDENLFIVDNTITSSRLDYIETEIEFDRSITYPTFCPSNSKLFQEVITGGETNKRAVMKFDGDVSFTLTQVYVMENENLKSEYFTGDIYVMAGSFALVANQTVKFYDLGVEYILASTEVSYEELILVGESLRSSDIK